MIEIKQFKCQFCNEIFDDPKACFQHELKELSITNGELKNWKKLRQRVVMAGQLVAEINDDESMQLFLKKVEELKKFETPRNLTGKRMIQD